MIALVPSPGHNMQHDALFDESGQQRLLRRNSVFAAQIRDNL